MLFVDRWALECFSSIQDVGIYFALYQIGYAPALLLFTGVYYVLAPIIFEQAGDATSSVRMKAVYRKVEFISFATLVLAILGSFLMWSAHDLIGSMLLGPLYAPHSFLLPWFVLTGGLFASGTQLLLSIQSGLDLKPLLLQRTASMVIALVCYVFGAMQFGLEGAVMGGVAFSILYLCVAFGVHLRVRRRVLLSEVASAG